MTRAPEWTFNVGFDWGHDLAGGRLVATGNLFHSAKVYGDFTNNYYQPSYTLVNGELSWTTPDEKWRFSVWTTNLLNEKVFQQIRPGALGTDVIYELPRRVGVGAQLKF
jgi:iron complex outermembrane receptor protein